MIIPLQITNPTRASEHLTWAFGLVVVVMGIWSAWQTARSSTRKTETESSISLLTEYREALDDLRAELATERSERKAAEAVMTARIDRLVRHERISDDYIARLRQHILNGQPPPPPAWPEGLMTPPAA